MACTIALGRAPVRPQRSACWPACCWSRTVGFWGYGEVAYPVRRAGRRDGQRWRCSPTWSSPVSDVLIVAARPRCGRSRSACAGMARSSAAAGAVGAVGASRWRLRLADASASRRSIVVAWAVPMIQLSGGWDVYRQAHRGLPAGLVAAVGLRGRRLRLGRRHPGHLQPEFPGQLPAPDARASACCWCCTCSAVGSGRRGWRPTIAADSSALWVVPPLVVYVFAHLGEPGYVLSLAPQASIADRAGDRRPARRAGARSPTSCAPRLALAAAGALGRAGRGGLLTLAIVGWNVQAFARGVGPGPLPDLRAHDATTSGTDRLRAPAAGATTTFVLAHDIFRQLQLYVPDVPRRPAVQRVRARFSDGRDPHRPAAGNDADRRARLAPAGRARGRRACQRSGAAAISHVSACGSLTRAGASAVEHGYQYLRLIR